MTLALGVAARSRGEWMCGCCGVLAHGGVEGAAAVGPLGVFPRNSMVVLRPGQSPLPHILE